MAPAITPQNHPKVSPQVLAGRTFRMMREYHGLTLQEVADRVGIDKSHLSRVETGQRPVGPDLEDRLCTLFAELPAPKKAS